MRVAVLARKNVAAMKTGARHLLRSVGVLSPSTGTQFFPSAFANGVKNPQNPVNVVYGCPLQITGHWQPYCSFGKLRSPTKHN